MNHNSNTYKEQIPVKNVTTKVFPTGQKGIVRADQMVGDGHQAKVYTSRDDKSICLKVFEPFKDKDALNNAECEFKVA
jgi:hypothetical protein